MAHPHGEYSNGNSIEIDVEVMFPGDKLAAACVGSLLTTGWRGGSFVMFVGDFQVEISDGTAAAGFLLRASEEVQGGVNNTRSEYRYTGIQPANALSPNTVAMIAGGGRYMFRVFETNDVTDRATGPALVYAYNDPLYISERGLLTNEFATLGGVGIADPIFVGYVSALPSAATDQRLGIDLKF